MAIQNDADTLKQRIIAALTQTTLKEGNININEKTGKVTKTDQSPALKHPNAQPNIKITAGKPAHLRFQNQYDSEYQVGIDAMIEIIVREVLNYLQQNIELVLKTRYDSLEDAYNLMLTTMTAQGSSLSAVPITSAIGAALSAISLAGGGPTRSLTTTLPLKLKETTIIK